MAKCVQCGKFLPAKGKDGALGCKCRASKAPPTKDRSPSGSPSADGGVPEVPTTGGDDGHRHELNTASELRLLRAELRAMRDELTGEIRDLRREVGDLRNSITACQDRVRGLEDRVRVLENTRSNAEDLEKSVSRLKMELNDRDQELLASDDEISGLAEESGESAIHLVVSVAGKLGIQLDSRDIIFAERVGPPSRRGEPAQPGEPSQPTGAVRPRRLVVRLLARRALRDELLRSARVRRGATSAGLGQQAPARRFYVNERLNKQNKILFYQARQAASKRGWRFVWTSRGRILTRQAEGEPIHCIRTEADLPRVFGPDASLDLTV